MGQLAKRLSNLLQSKGLEEDRLSREILWQVDCLDYLGLLLSPSLLVKSEVLGEGQAKLHALIPSNVDEVVSNRRKAATMARLPAEVLECFGLGCPSLVRCHRRQEGASQSLMTRHIRLEFDFDAVGADLPIQRVIDLLKVGEKRNFTTQLG